MTTDARTYRFAPLDQSGWLLGLQGPQCVILAVGLGGAAVLLQVGAPPIAALVLMLLGAAAAFVPVAGGRADEWLPIVGRHAWLSVTGARTWRRPVYPQTRSQGASPGWPAVLDGIEIRDLGAVELADGPVAVGAVLDRRNRAMSVSVRVRGRGFSLVERSEQERLVALWGDVLAGFCGERSEVSSARITEWSAPADLDSHLRFHAEHGSARSSIASEDYRALLAAAQPQTVGHEALVTVTVDQRRTRARSRSQRHDVMEDAVREHLRALMARLDAAGLDAAPLDAGDLASTIRSRLDPCAAVGRARSGWRTLAAAVGLSGSAVAAPMAVESSWSNVRVDGSWHRAFWIAEWPRLDVGPSWFEGLLLHAGVTRTISLHFEPVPPSRSRRRIDRDSTRLAADEEQRSRTGFRIGAAHRRAQAAVRDREAELVAGFAELDFVGVVVVSAGTEEDLCRNAADLEQVAAQNGLHLRALDARHDLALLCGLPIGRGLSRTRSA